MFNHDHIDSNDKVAFYDEILMRVKGVLYEEPDAIANMANVASILFNNMENINWAGFYRFTDAQLVLGPFQGQSACIRIPVGRGVCGKTAETMETQRVDDVHQFEGHIPCDAASMSEIVIPLVVDGQLVAILDIDSPILNRFDDVDQKYLEEIAHSVATGSAW